MLSGPWPPVVGEHLAVKTQEDGHPTPKICEFLGFVPGIPKEAGNVRVKVYNQYFLNVPTNLALWQDNDSTEFIIEPGAKRHHMVSETLAPLYTIFKLKLGCSGAAAPIGDEVL